MRTLQLGFGLCGLALLLAVACTTADKPSASHGNEAGAGLGGGAAGEPGGGQSGDGGLVSEGGATVAEAGAGGSSQDAAGASAGGAASTDGGDCFVSLSMNTSNAVDGSAPLDQMCEAISFEGQMNFEIYAGVAPDQRNLNIDFFESPVAGASIKLEDGFDFQAGKGAAASYVDSAGVWNADSGTVAIEKVEGDRFTVSLKNVHFVVLGGGPQEPTNNGEFVANGKITADSMPSQ